MSAYDIREFLRTAYQPFAYCVPSKKTLILRTKRGGVTLKYTDKIVLQNKNISLPTDPALGFGMDRSIVGYPPLRYSAILRYETWDNWLGKSRSHE